MSKEVRDVNQADFVAALKEQTVTLVDFWAPWCGPCRMVGPVVEAVAAELGDRAGFLKVNVDDNQALAQQYGVMSIPTLIVFKHGEEVARMVGARGKAELVDAVKQFL